MAVRIEAHFRGTLNFWCRCPECGQYWRVATALDDVPGPWSSRLAELPRCEAHPSVWPVVCFDLRSEVSEEAA